MKFDCGFVIYVINQLILKINQNIVILNLIKTKNIGVFVGKENQFIRPDINKIASKNNNCLRDCYNQYFHTFRFECIHHIEMTYGDFVKGIFSDKKLKQIVREKAFIHKLTINIYSNPSRRKVCYYLKFPIPIMQRQLIRIISNNPEYVRTHCMDLYNPFHLSCRKRYIDIQSHKFCTYFKSLSVEGFYF